MCGSIGVSKQDIGELKRMSDLIEQTKSIGLTSDYQLMLDIITESEGAITSASTNYGKSHSQFQYSLLDCSGPIAGPTKIRNQRQVLAVIERTKDALDDALLSIRETEIRKKKLEEENIAEEPYNDDLQQLEIKKLELQERRIKKAILGAVRKLTTYVMYFRELDCQIRKELKKGPEDPITEEDFERDEERFHIMKAFQQGLQAARSHGRIDHGNMIYMDDIGISGTMAQLDVRQFLEIESKAIADNKSVHEIYNLEYQWLQSMSEKYKGCSKNLSEIKGIPLMVSEALIRIER